MSEQGATARVLELDALRGLAALAVVAFHYTTFYQQEIGHSHPLGFGFAAGNYGVHLFFLISGFVIFMTLERTRSAMDFVVSRFSRLFPAYWAALAVTALVVYTLGLERQRLAPGEALSNLTMVQDFFGMPLLDGSYWTLQVELFFYAQMLLWYALGLLGRIRWIVLLWLTMAVGYALTERMHVHFSYTARELLILRHIPFFAIGVLFYRIWSGAPGRGVDIALIALSLLAIHIAYASPYFWAALACTAIFALLLLGALRWLRAAPFAFFGGISYSLYLLHQAIGFALIYRLEHMGVPAALSVAIVAGGMILAAWALTRWVERPAMHAIRAWWRTRRPATATTGG